MNDDAKSDDAAIAENVKRTVAQIALKKVRKLTEELEQEQAAQRQREKGVLVVFAVAGIALLIGLGLMLLGLRANQQQARIDIGGTAPAARATDAVPNVAPPADRKGAGT